jgi:hypothetical protein
MQLSAGIFILQPLNLAITLSQSKADRHDSGVNKKKKIDKQTLASPLATYQHHILHLQAQPCHPEQPEK